MKEPESTLAPLARADLEDLFLGITLLQAVVKRYTIKSRSQIKNC